MARDSSLSLAIVWLLALPIRFYRAAISPWMRSVCRYDPSCSKYALEALQEHGPSGLILAARRIARCHPWGGFGHDPVPRKVVTR